MSPKIVKSSIKIKIEFDVGLKMCTFLNDFFFFGKDLGHLLNETIINLFEYDMKGEQSFHSGLIMLCTSLTNYNTVKNKKEEGKKRKDGKELEKSY